MSKKDLKYFLGLDYDVKVVKIEDEDGFEYKAYSNELDDFAFYVIGDTKADAIESFEEVRTELFEHYFENNIPIPEPVREKEEILPSGKFIIRTSPKTHAELIVLAKKNNQSLNQYINTLFDRFNTSELILENMKKRMNSMTEKCPSFSQDKNYDEIKYPWGDRYNFANKRSKVG